MKILQVIQFFSSKHGGSAMVPYELSKHLQKNGHDVTILTTDFQINNDFFKSLDGVKVIPFHYQLNIGGLLISSSMEGYLKEHIDKFDVIHMHNFRTYQNIIAHKFAKKYGVPYVLQAHGSILPFFQKQRLKTIFDVFFGYRILNDATKVIAVAKTEAEQYKKMGVADNKIEAVPNGINISEYEKLPKKGEFRKKYLIRDDEKIILYLGRIHKIKGIDLLVSAYSDLIKELDGVRLVIVGTDDGFLSMLKRQIDDLNIGDKILFTSHLFDREKLEAYVDADIYVLPSVYEIFGITVLEACACSTPVIVTDRCGIADIVDGRVGYVVKYDKSQLRDAIIKVLSTEKLRRKFGAEGRWLVGEVYGWDKIVKKVEEIYKNAILNQNISEDK